MQEFFHPQYDGWWLVPRWFFVLPMPACQECLLGFERLLKQYWQNLPKKFENDDSSAFLSKNFLCPKHSPKSLSPKKTTPRQRLPSPGRLFGTLVEIAGGTARHLNNKKNIQPASRFVKGGNLLGSQTGSKEDRQFPPHGNWILRHRTIWSWDATSTFKIQLLLAVCCCEKCLLKKSCVSCLICITEMIIYDNWNKCFCSTALD